MDKYILKDIAIERAKEVYGEDLPADILTRLEEELSCINEQRFIDEFYYAMNLVEKCKESGIIIKENAVCSYPLLAYFLSNTDVNPLSAHYRCPKCYRIEYNASYKCGTDMEDKTCPSCGTPFLKDGYNLREGTRLLESAPCISFATADIETVLNILTELCNGCEIVKCGRKINPATGAEELCLFRQAIPDGVDYVDAFIVPSGEMEFPENKKITFVEWCYLSAKSPYIGITEITSIDEQLENIYKKIAEITKPSSFNDVVRTFGLALGMGLWNDNIKHLINNQTLSLDETITCREDIVRYLVKNGYGDEEAYQLSEKVRKGKGLGELEVEELKNHNVDQWFIELCKEIRYAPSRKHCILYALEK